MPIFITNKSVESTSKEAKRKEIKKVYAQKLS
jgi:hypothetical protein